MTPRACLLCGRELELLERGVQRHPDVEDCRVIYTDFFGVALTAEETAIFETLRGDPQPLQPDLDLGLSLYPPVEVVISQMFEEAGLERLGGASSGKGWSSYALAQRCFYAWKRRHVDQAQPDFFVESESLAIGTIIHLFLALYYSNMMGEHEDLPPLSCYNWLKVRANPAFVNEGWRLFEAYQLYYALDDLEPLAVEYDLCDPRTRESCRYDLIGHYRKHKPGRLAGTYLFEHKSAGRFDWDTLDGWANDGEVIGEAGLWHKLGLEKRFGKLRGVCVNIIGKQKEPKFHRTVIAPDVLLINSHFDDLRRWDGLLQLCKSANSWPRSRANCINRWGRCQWWEHCATGAK